MSSILVPLLLYVITDFSRSAQAANNQLCHFQSRFFEKSHKHACKFKAMLKNNQKAVANQALLERRQRFRLRL
jgi:hypothetical protein